MKWVSIKEGRRQRIMPQQDQPLYESFYQLSARPFAAAPRTDRFYAARSIEAARQTLQRVAERSEGIGIAIGATGTGKTLLCQMLADSLKASMGVVYLASGRLASRRALLQAILFELGLRYRGMDEAELRLSLLDYLTSSKRTFSTLLLIVDEAQTLPIKLLEELRLIGNLAQDGQSRIRVLLAGSPALEEHLTSPKLDSFNQRIAGRCYISNLDREETAAFIRFQITAAGGQPEAVLADDAYEAVYRATDGIPRLINQICDHSLILGQLSSIKPITAGTVQEAWADLQQLPAPWDGQQASQRPKSGVVEFGGLDDDGEPVESIPFRPVKSAVINNSFASGLPSNVDFGDLESSDLMGGGLEMADPIQRIERIEQQLEELDGFKPAGSIVPEVELMFPELQGPFDEQFAEEEIIFDRYSSLEANLFSELPHVTSSEGHELSAMLNQVVRPKRPAAQLATETVEDYEGPEFSLNLEEPLQTQAPAAAAAAPRPMSAALFGTPMVDPPMLDQRKLASTITPAAQRALHELELSIEPELSIDIDEDFDDDSDEDMLVIEDDLPEAIVIQRPSPIVRRQEYRQLFTRLRRG